MKDKAAESNGPRCEPQNASRSSEHSRLALKAWVSGDREKARRYAGRVNALDLEDWLYGQMRRRHRSRADDDALDAMTLTRKLKRDLQE